MKVLLLLVFLSAFGQIGLAQLVFDKRFVQSEDRWVAFRPDKDSAYAFGFIYIDPSAGLTLNYEGSFKISPTGVYQPSRLDSANVKYRLEPNQVLVAFIPENKFGELEISAVPDWLRYYKVDSNSIKRLYQWGYQYNAWGECAKALTYLERAKAIDSGFKGLAVELAYSYNCLQRYQEAEDILQSEITSNSKDAYVNKEYIYTLTKNNKIDLAINQFEISMKAIVDKQYNAENCYNILQYFYNRKDKESFKKWYAILQQQPNENQLLTQYANNMKNAMEK